jgi:hypothetical protein
MVQLRQRDRRHDKSTPISLYQPSKEVCDFTADVKKEYGQGIEILNRPWNELNDYLIIERMNKDQRTFNALVDETVENPAEGWKWRGLAMHAHLTANYIVPWSAPTMKRTAACMRDILD